MRTLIDLKEEDVVALDAQAKEEGVSRASLIRRAVADFLKKRSKAEVDTAFGVWKKAKEVPSDGLAYQEKIRKEW